jgi:hypothetical protein
VGDLVKPKDLARGRTGVPMRFEIEAELEDNIYGYVIAFEFPEGFKERRVLEESERLTVSQPIPETRCPRLATLCWLFGGRSSLAVNSSRPLTIRRQSVVFLKRIRFFCTGGAALNLQWCVHSAVWKSAGISSTRSFVATWSHERQQVSATRLCWRVRDHRFKDGKGLPRRYSSHLGPRSP